MDPEGALNIKYCINYYYIRSLIVFSHCEDVRDGNIKVHLVYIEWGSRAQVVNHTQDTSLMRTARVI